MHHLNSKDKIHIYQIEYVVDMVEVKGVDQQANGENYAASKDGNYCEREKN